MHPLGVSSDASEPDMTPRNSLHTKAGSNRGEDKNLNHTTCTSRRTETFGKVLREMGPVSRAESLVVNFGLFFDPQLLCTSLFGFSWLVFQVHRDIFEIAKLEPSSRSPLLIGGCFTLK